jgi:pilus assembly protein CpaC
MTRARIGSIVAIAVLVNVATAAQEPVRTVTLLVSRSTVLATNFDITRIAITNPTVADATVVQPREVLIDGKAPGRVSLILWGPSERVHYEVAVQSDGNALEQQLRAAFSGEDVRLVANDDALLLSGSISSAATMVRIIDLVQAAAPKARVVNMMQVPGLATSQQVMLQVRFAEVSRRALTELGASIFTSPGGGIDGNWLGRTTTQQFPAPIFEEDKLVVSDFLNVFLLNWNNDIGIAIRALKARGFFQSLAEPNLIAYNGQEASFLAGGEIPVPIVQGTQGIAAATVTYKEFGVRLTIIGDLIRLHVAPEVSSLDFGNGVTLSGFRIPALSTRRAETEVELRDGQSFAIAGLIDDTAQDDRSKVPLLGDIPILGAFFKSRATRQERTELLVLITPRLVRPIEPGVETPLPVDPALFFPKDEKKDEKRPPAPKPPKSGGQQPEPVAR